MRPSSSIADGFVDPLFGSAAVDAAVSDEAWLQAMLDFEAALAESEADAGLVPVTAAAEIAAACRAESFDVAEIGRPLRGLRQPRGATGARVDGRASRRRHEEYVHLGATSQDVIDTSPSLDGAPGARRDPRRPVAAVVGVRDACCEPRSHAHDRANAAAAGRHRRPSGYKAAGWMVSIDEARVLLRRVRFERLAVQLGGAAGTLASLEGVGVDVAHRLAVRLGLVEPRAPVAYGPHPDRGARRAHSALLSASSARSLATSCCSLRQRLPKQRNRSTGTSSTLPQKRNPVRAVLVLAAAERAPGLVGTLFTTMIQEHERAAGAWHAEWETVRDLLRIAGAREPSRAALLEFPAGRHPARMAENLADDGGLVMAENLALQLVSTRWARHRTRHRATLQRGVDRRTRSRSRMWSATIPKCEATSPSDRSPLRSIPRATSGRSTS